MHLITRVPVDYFAERCSLTIKRGKCLNKAVDRDQNVTALAQAAVDQLDKGSINIDLQVVKGAGCCQGN
jgi:hypothetical protein